MIFFKHHFAWCVLTGTTYGTGVGESSLPARWHPRHPSSSATALFCAAMHDDVVVAGGRDGRMHLYDLRTVSKTAVVDGHERELFTMSMAYPRLATGESQFKGGLFLRFDVYWSASTRHQ